MVDKWFAGLGLVVCIVILLGRARTENLQALLRRLYAWPRKRRAARREAERAIERARRKVERDGNVYRPKSFERKPPDEPLH